MYIETERLVITELTADMAEDVYLNSLDEDMERFLPDEVFESTEDAEKRICFLIEKYGGEEGPFVYPVFLKSGENIGYVQLSPADEGWEIGYHVAEKYTGNGYASEAVKAFLPVISKKMSISIIYGTCLPDNALSARVLKKSGFLETFRGTGSYQGQKRTVLKYIWTA